MHAHHTKWGESQGYYGGTGLTFDRVEWLEIVERVSSYIYKWRWVLFLGIEWGMETMHNCTK